MLPVKIRAQFWLVINNENFSVFFCTVLSFAQLLWMKNDIVNMMLSP